MTRSVVTATPDTPLREIAELLEKDARASAAVIEQERILARPLRHDALGETRDKDDAEAATTGLVRGADKQPPVPARRRLPVERHKAIVQHVARLLDRDRTHGGHWPQLGEHPQHTLGSSERADRELLAASGKASLTETV